MSEEELYNRYYENFDKKELVERIISINIELKKILKESNKITYRKKDILKKIEYIIYVLELGKDE